MIERIAPEQFDTLDDVPEPCENPLLAGHDEPRRQLASAIGTNRLHHALLLAGPQGIGKATLAFHLARHLLAGPHESTGTGAFGPPDVSSQTFRLVAQGAHPGLLHLTRPFMEKERKFRTVITVEEVRRVGRFLSMTAMNGGHRVVIVDPAEDMNNSAANALLKNLEEPPPSTVFILITHSPGRLLPTIRSRCQTIRLHPLPEDTLIEVLSALQAQLPADTTGRERLLHQAAGSVRNAFLLSHYGGLEIVGAMEEILQAAKFDADKAHRLGEAVTGRDRDVQFDIFNTNLLEQVERRATSAAHEQAAEPAYHLSRLHEDLSAAIIETETYNLDRRQHVVGSLAEVHALLAALPFPAP